MPKATIRVGAQYQAEIPSCQSQEVEEDDCELIEFRDFPLAHERESCPQSFSREEADAFTKGYAIYGAMLEKIQKKFLPQRSLKDVVWFYYIWNIDPRTEQKMVPITQKNMRKSKGYDNEMDIIETKKDAEKVLKEIADGKIPGGLHPIREAWLATDQMKAVKQELFATMESFTDESERYRSTRRRRRRCAPEK
ncbi:hypothetical protein ACOME3_004692 [Neoechinorhynchus agilis]